MSENASVRRFMVLSAARTGSNLLLSLLSAHPAIKTYGELFNLDALPPDHLREALDDPIAYLRARVYRELPPGQTAVGFKMFYDHLTDDYYRKLVDTSSGVSEGTKRRFERFTKVVQEDYDRAVLADRFRAAWAFLSDDASLAMIHLRRHNLLHSLVSLKTAYATRQWWKLKSGEDASPAVYVDPDECRRYFQKLDDFAREADAAFAAHPKLDLSYEELVTEREETLRRVFDFLQVAPHEVSTRMQKQRSEPASASVSNYRQLQEHFEGTPWAGFFD